MVTEAVIGSSVVRVAPWLTTTALRSASLPAVGHGPAESGVHALAYLPEQVDSAVGGAGGGCLVVEPFDHLGLRARVPLAARLLFGVRDSGGGAQEGDGRWPAVGPRMRFEPRRVYAPKTSSQRVYRQRF